jgi:hypothetical protein
MQVTSRLKYLQEKNNCNQRQTRLEEHSNVPFCVLMRGANHLRKINDDRFPSFAFDEDIELVKVSVYKTRASEPNNQVH